MATNQQTELEGLEHDHERSRRAYHERLGDAGVRPAWGWMNRRERTTVKRRPKWLARLLRLLP